MAEDVCDVFDSWEDIVEGCDWKLSRMTVSASDTGRSGDGSASQVSGCKSGSSTNSEESSDGRNSIKILKRPPTMDGSGTTSKSSSQPSGCTNAATNSSKSYDLNNYVNSEPFVPSSYSSGSDNPRSLQFPQITLEDNTRTQYVPQVKILKRPKEKNGGNGRNKLSPVKNNCGNPGKNSGLKSYEEREAEYARARLRILGSAVPTYDVEQSNSVELSASENVANCLGSPSTSRSNGLNCTQTQTDVPIIRLPQGPDGSRGFTVKR